MNEKHEQWLRMSFEERRGNVAYFLIDHSLNKVNPCSKEFAEIGHKIKTEDGSCYEVFKITKNPAFDWTFIHIKTFKQ